MIVAWHGEPDLKAAVMERLRDHHRLDQIVQRVYFDSQGRGCHLGCITHANEYAHKVAERLFGIEQRVGYWLEAVFEGLPREKCAAWVLDSTAAIYDGADLSRCHHVLYVWLLGPSGLLTIDDGNRLAIERVRALHERAAAGYGVSGEEWESARDSAQDSERNSARDSAPDKWSASRAAMAAVESTYVESTYSPVWAMATAIESAEWSERRTVARVVEEVRAAAWEKIAAKSIEIFSAAPIVAGARISDDVRDGDCF